MVCSEENATVRLSPNNPRMAWANGSPTTRGTGDVAQESRAARVTSQRRHALQPLSEASFSSERSDCLALSLSTSCVAQSAARLTCGRSRSVKLLVRCH